MKRAPVLNSFQESGLIDIIPLHDQELLKRLKDEWFKAPLLGIVLKFVFKEICRKSTLGVTKYLKKVSCRQVTYREINCCTSYNSYERQTLVSVIIIDLKLGASYEREMD